MKILVIPFSLVLIAMSSTGSGAQPRDEAKASRFLYCGALNSYWVYALKQKQADSHEIEARQSASDYFWEATIALSDKQFTQAHRNEAMQQVRSVVSGMEQDKGSRLTSEDLSCARTMHDEVVPLLKAENLAPGDSFDTSVSVLHMADVTRDVAGWHDMRHPDCKFQRATGAKIVKREKDSVTEHWTIQACDGKQFTYQVFILPGDGALTDAVGDVEAPAAEPRKP